MRIYSLLCLGLLSLFHPLSVSGCTTVSVKTTDGSTVVGRTMEFEFSPILNPAYALQTYPKGSLQFSRPSEKPKNDYAFAAIGVDIPLPGHHFVPYITATEGMNSEGLTISLQLLRAAEYEQAKGDGGGEDGDSRPTVYWVDLVAYLLGTCGSWEDVASRLENLKVIDPPVWNVLDARAHWIVTDASGSQHVFTWLKGKLVVWDNSEVGVTTNDPPLDWHLQNLANFVNVSPFKPSVPEWVQSDSPVGAVPFSGKKLPNGMNLLGLPGDFTPAGRFVRMYFLSKFAESEGTGGASRLGSVYEGIEAVQNILNSVGIPRGSLRVDHSKKTSQTAEETSLRLFVGEMKNGNASSDKRLRGSSPFVSSSDSGSSEEEEEDSQWGSLNIHDLYNRLEEGETQWTVLKLPKEGKLLFRTYQNTQWRMLDVKALTEAKEKKTLRLFDSKNSADPFEQLGVQALSLL
uniref:Choloylglycine hydrolase/NAAA C-terminal domain-containing protein n=1 Tax=Chromera velia CCMP2878 TaxID=1169474 RepID=A0A0G4GYJ4_9ALVE|eukprot:Cvel_23929.t1-p1 / transcript=Cvel_23929.t1 / gene=Cvel_23929 / organism=Chromera_velia_CCMP2878 / gene_product=Choloylglycine hydrolase, putative / transcript_product=Choloylglycine hydrolase, putative / location=Cvel_scaffold2527:10768-12144(-) / protein_length=459 / sequence_SO=supercontig / SO=protein_coding / is_pseudo=false